MTHNPTISLTTWQRWLFCLLLPALLAVTASLSFGQAPSAVETQRKTSTPYSGDLTIFDYPDRDQKLHLDQVMDLLSITPGKTVADIGAGSGWFTVRAAKRVTSSGKVYAVDINPEAIAYINQRAHKDGLANVITILGAADDPKLPLTSVDAVLLLKTYHEVAKPVDLMRNLRASLRPGARVGIIDRNGNGANHGVAKTVVLEEMQAAGYRLLEEHDELVKDDKMDYLLIFVVK
ncbi:MAG TPA: class I SAM-dependent methyltransferase [Candidatus Angelobacter sp.]|jgi:cyclopropane fatty-acyl-phospholipid synthase-like methyltransferase|nr:class I SAM-dependent methyltransferase [Candidatus Angelobacter sp.]